MALSQRSMGRRNAGQERVTVATLIRQNRALPMLIGVQPANAAAGVRRAALFALTIVLVLAAITAWQFRRQVHQEHIRDATRAVRILEEHADKVVGGHLASLDHLEWIIRDLGWDEAADRRRLHEHLRAIKGSHPEVQSVWLFDARGDVRATSVAFPAPAVNFADRDYFQSAMRGEKWFIGRVVFGRITQEFNFNLSKRLDDADGRFLGVVVMSLYPAYFRDFYGSVGPDAAVVALVREDGALLARYPPPPEDLTTAQVPPGFIAQLRAAASGSFQQRSSLQHRDVLYTYRRLTLPLYVVYGTAVADIERRWLALIGSYLPFALAALVGLGIFGWAAYRQASAVDRSESLLRDANLDLERRINERTQDLAATNAALERSLAVKDVLMREIHHRVKNNLQVIASIIRLRSKRASPEAGALLTEILSRIAAIGQIHNQLYNTDDLANIDLAAYLDALCGSLRENEPNAHVSLTLEAERVVVHMDTAMPLALIVVELITNAYKHAFPGGRAGEIRVTLKRRGDVAELAVRDNGIGTPAAPESRGSLGLQLVRLLAQQADATIETRVENGTIVTIRFTIGEVANTDERPREPGAMPAAVAR